jgi:hypothetical protein
MSALERVWVICRDPLTTQAIAPPPPPLPPSSAHSALQLLRDLVRCGRKFPVINFSQYVLPPTTALRHFHALCMYVKRRSVAAFRENMQ